MTYQPQQPPVMPGHTIPPPQGDWTPPKPKSKAVPVLAGIVVLLVLIVGALAYLLTTKGDGASPATATAAAGPFDRARAACNVVAGYLIEDGGKTLAMTVGGAYVSTGTMDCVFDQLTVPHAVREHVASTRALDGQQTDAWPGYTARWTFYPDDGLKMTIQAT
jgi:hypothetical protein